jgi:polyisoprenyl-phosphate glycosyltransferase
MTAADDDEFAGRVARLQAPILVLGASGFVGANLLLRLLEHRSDVVGTCGRSPAWRLEGVEPQHIRTVDLLVDLNVDDLLNDVQPRTVFNCVAYGAYSFETDPELIYRTNFAVTQHVVERLAGSGVAAYIHAGSSSEYGDNSAGPDEHDFLSPNSDYAVSKAACANLLHYLGHRRGMPCANLRLYSVYGPLEDSSRLIANVVRRGTAGELPSFVDPAISRDFVYVDDVCDAFVSAAVNLRAEDYGASFNIGSGTQTTIGDVAATARHLYGIEAEASFSMPARHWDVQDWYANVARARERLEWQPRTSFREGLERTTEWYRALADPERYLASTKEVALDAEWSVSAIIACYRDAEAIPIMHERLRATFEKLAIDYEIIFVNDNSPDESEEIIRRISATDRHVIGISHSRNFGSQAAFRSGMEIATKNSVVLLDGDLQDPPELIEQFVERWREGNDVVYGRRVKREASFFMQRAYRAFYYIFDRFSYIEIPRDAGDFSLIDRRVVQAMLEFPERDLFLRGVRAFVGFRQTGVDYTRPERMFGVTTNSLSKNLSWAKKGILSFSNVPLTMLSVLGTVLFVLSVLLGILQVIGRILLPSHTPTGITTLIVAVLFFGSINLFAIGLVGEYLGKIFEEVKQRPLFIRRHVVRGGEVRAAGGLEDTDDRMSRRK